jgi:glycerol-3-phosphate dehydrogenase
MERVRAIVQPELRWDDERWEWEVKRYVELWNDYYGIPEGVPDRLDGLEPEPRPVLRKPQPVFRIYLGLALLLALALAWILRRR